MREIAILVSDNCLASSLTGPQDLFNICNTLWNYLEGEDAEPLFRVRIVSADGEPVTTSSGIVIEPDVKLCELGSCDFLLIASYHYSNNKTLTGYIDHQRHQYQHILRLHAQGSMIGAYCSATFVLADTGLLDGYKATTSWWLTDTFKRRYPAVELALDQLVVEQNNVWTGGATTSYLNLCLKIVERLAGQQVASQVSKILLVDNNRVSQMAYMQLPLPSVSAHQDSVIAKCQDWIQVNLAKPISLEDMSEMSAMSKRNFIRRFKKAVGETPALYLQRLRIEAAKRYLETTNWSLGQIIEKVGYEDSSAFRRVFQKLTTLSPKAYRSKFSIAS